MQESWEGLRGRQASKVNNGGREREICAREVLDPLGKKGGLLYVPTRKRVVAGILHRRLWEVSGVTPEGAGTWAKPWESFEARDSGP